MKCFFPHRQFAGEYSTTYPSQSSWNPSFTAHRALPDVLSMEALFFESPLQDTLPSLTFRTPQQMIHQWNMQKGTRENVQCLVRFFGKAITKAHAKQLTRLDITPRTLQRCHSEQAAQLQEQPSCKNGCSSPPHFSKPALLRATNTQEISPYTPAAGHQRK